MVKKNVVLDESPIPAETPAMPEPALAETKPQPFDLGQWGGHPQWRCRLCPFDTLDGEEEYWRHYYQVHAQPGPQQIRSIFVADRYGNEV